MVWFRRQSSAVKFSFLECAEQQNVLKFEHYSTGVSPLVSQMLIHKELAPVWQHAGVCRI